MQPKIEEFMVVFGQVGSDAGYWVLTPHGVVHVPGNNPETREAYVAVMKNYAVLQAAALKEVQAAGLSAPVAAAGGMAA